MTEYKQIQQHILEDVSNVSQDEVAVSFHDKGSVEIYKVSDEYIRVIINHAERERVLGIRLTLEEAELVMNKLVQVIAAHKSDLAERQEMITRAIEKIEKRGKKSEYA